MASGLRSVIALLLLALSTSAQAQSADEVIDRYVTAAGGAKALRSVTSLRLEGSVEGGGEFLWLTKAPGAYYLEVRHAGGRILEAFNGRSAWRQDEGGEPRTLTGGAQTVARATAAHRNGRLLASPKHKTRLQLLARESVEGRAAHAVLVATASGVERKLWFDAETHLILKEELAVDGGAEVILFGDYRAIGGVQEPHRIRLLRGEQTLELIVRRAEHNGLLDAAQFDFPARAAAPLPDFATLFKDVLENQERLERAREDYTYTKTETDLEVDERGRIREKPSRTYEVYHVAGKEIDKLVAIDGRPLRDEDAGKQQARVERSMRERRKKEQGRSERKAETGGREEVSVSQLLRVCQFVNPRRERFRAQQVLVYDFGPRPGERHRSRAESWMRKLEGNLWIDEHARGIVRVEAHVNDSIKMAGGFVFSVSPGSSVVFEQELVNGEIWLPRYAELNVWARLLLLKGVKLNQRQRFSDYRKFGVETSSEIKPPRE